MSTSEIPDFDPDHPRPLRPEEIEAIKAKHDTGRTRAEAEAIVQNLTQNG
ncbi:hypothetical protein BH765_gp05 [Gordonia phage Kvothe]|uniref:Uncharacterized protein n=1 Tax=Gordonia phage Kvothe TaxID=1838071 RepID=A0A160DE15_9CAUD|nr:hypothetical protein BH765_gp05 [Gordonia phage Kvothe]ANA86070.1 hypothetical protein PBI_KVOTHE_5 [Gordonia phage Kvothe]